MVTAFQRQQSSARLFYVRLHLCPHLGHRQAMAPATVALADRSRFKLASTALIEHVRNTWQFGLIYQAGFNRRLNITCSPNGTIGDDSSRNS
jgi:hypothetical protein